MCCEYRGEKLSPHSQSVQVTDLRQHRQDHLHMFHMSLLLIIVPSVNGPWVTQKLFSSQHYILTPWLPAGSWGSILYSLPLSLCTSHSFIQDPLPPNLTYWLIAGLFEDLVWYLNHHEGFFGAIEPGYGPLWVPPKSQHTLRSPLTANNGSCLTPEFDSLLKICKNCACLLHEVPDFEKWVGIDEKARNSKGPLSEDVHMCLHVCIVVFQQMYKNCRGRWQEMSKMQDEAVIHCTDPPSQFPFAHSH